MTGPPGNGNGGTWRGIAARAAGSLPPEFLALCLINACFVLGLLWYLHAENASRERVFGGVLAVCQTMLERHDGAQ